MACILSPLVFICVPFGAGAPYNLMFVNFSVVLWKLLKNAEMIKNGENYF
jgi:hypothetical protein